MVARFGLCDVVAAALLVGVERAKLAPRQLLCTKINTMLG
jgi:hypothetical protein